MSSLFWLALFVTSVILVDRVQTQSRECSTNGHVDGCSVPRFLPFYYKRLFSRPCDKHDVCMCCGKEYGISERRCNRSIRREMRRRCWRLVFWRRPRCRRTALRVRGGPEYFDPSPNWCLESWVPTCLNV